MKNQMLTLLLFAGLSAAQLSAAPGRHIQSLDGTWRIADSVSATEMPAEFTAFVPVPGLANLAIPHF